MSWKIKIEACASSKLSSKDVRVQNSHMTKSNLILESCTATFLNVSYYKDTKCSARMCGFLPTLTGFTSSVLILIKGI